MLKFGRHLPAWLAVLSFAAPMPMPAMAESIKGNGIPHCPPPTTRKVATLTFTILVTGEHKTSQGDEGSASMHRERTLNGVVRMVYKGDRDMDPFDPRSLKGTVTKTEGTPDQWGPGTKSPPVSPIGGGTASGGGAGVDNILRQAKECQKLPGNAVLACQMAVVQSIANAKKECERKGGTPREDGTCGGGGGGNGQARIPDSPFVPGQCIPGKKGVKSGPFEEWASTDCTIRATIADRGELMARKDRSTTLVPLNRIEYGAGGTGPGVVGCQAAVVISKMTNTASLMLDHGGVSIMVTDVTGGHAGRITDYGNGDKMKQTFAALKSTGAVFNTGSRVPMSWSAVKWGQGTIAHGIILPNVSRNGGSTTNFAGSWTHEGSNPPGTDDYNYSEGPSRPSIKTLTATSSTKINWRFDADPDPHVIK